jgi:hypothetical protein
MDLCVPLLSSLVVVAIIIDIIISIIISSARGAGSAYQQACLVGARVTPLSIVLLPDVVTFSARNW